MTKRQNIINFACFLSYKMENDNFLYVDEWYCENYEREIRKTIELAWDDEEDNDELEDLVSGCGFIKFVLLFFYIYYCGQSITSIYPDALLV